MTTASARAEGDSDRGSAAAPMLWVAGGAILVFLLWRNRFFLHDDAFISLRYAMNLVEHRELAWNIGERVEGFTNLLHLLTAAMLIAAGLEPIAALRLIGLLSVLVILIAFERSTRHLSSLPAGPWARAAGAFLLLASSPMALWALGGLEAPMLSALFALAFWPLIASLNRPALSVGRFLSAGALLAAAFAVRPDAVIVTAAAALAVALRSPAGRRVGLPAAALLLAPTILLGIGLTLWRLHMFGDVVPNTFHAKTGIELGARWRSGVIYLVRSAPSVPLVLLAVLSLIRRNPAEHRILLPATAGLIGYGSYVVWAGGDHMPGARLLVPVLPLAALALALGVGRLARREALAWAALAVFVSTASALSAGRHLMDPAAFAGRLVGEYIASNWPLGSLVALNTAGSPPFYATELRFIDMLGLNDRTIARRVVGAPQLEWQRVPGHGKGDGEYVLWRRPDFVILGPAEGELASRPWFLSDLELAGSAEFQRCYRLERASIPYDDAMAAQGPKRPRPLVFTYYRRTCG